MKFKGKPNKARHDWVMRHSVPYRDSLLEALKDPVEAVGYLNAAIEEGDRKMFLVALRNVIDARGPISELARKSGLHRVSLHKMFSGDGNPTAESLVALFRALGLRLHFEKPPRPARDRRKAA